MVPPPRFLGLAVVALVAVSAGIVACSGDGDEAADTTSSTSTIPTPKRQLEDIELAVTRAELVSPVDPLAPLPENVRDDIVEVVDTFLKLTSAGPILTGQPARGWGRLLTSDALGRARGPDRPALVDDDAPRSRRVEAEEATLAVMALAGHDGQYQTAVAHLEWKLKGTGGARSVTVHRFGEISLVPAPQGGWLISSYDLNVTRKLGKARATTTTAGEGD